MKEISKYTSEISNPDLADNMTRVRELNDQINKLLRVKFYWEKRIIELGGVDYIRASNSRNRGRKQIYFGVAKQLPEAQKNDSNNEIQYKPKVSLKTLNQRLTNDYYGIGRWHGVNCIYYAVISDSPVPFWHHRKYVVWGKRSMAFWYFIAIIDVTFQGIYIRRLDGY